ncbi:MAG: 50S ribosome-binding GTPase [Mollicutes bacterium]|nr:MAG: 50S ribosome-binding GTPase [Mollicutes bacterium]
MLKIGIIGLPNVGKSSLFNLITHSTIEVANYPFATIEPNIGIVELKDLRIKKLVTLYKSKKVIFPLIKF